MAKVNCPLSPFSDPLEELLRHPAVYRTRDASGLEPAGPAPIPTGYPALDGCLPQGGWSGGTLTELLWSREGIGELRLVLPALAELSRRGGQIAWIGAPHVPYAPALVQHGVELSRVLWVQGATPGENLWAAEQALGSGLCRAVLLWLKKMGTEKMGTCSFSLREKEHVPIFVSLRRLQLAAERGGSWGVLFRRSSAGQQSSPATLRLGLDPSPGGLAVTVRKCRGGGAGKSLIVDDGYPSIEDFRRGPPQPG